MPTITDHYPELYQNFRWQVPKHFNLAHVCCQRWAHEPTRVALVCENQAGETTQWTYAQLQQQANQLSNALRALGVGRGERVAIVLPQRVETVVAHLAVYQLGAIAMPMSVLFGPDALEFRLQDSQAKVAIGDAGSLENLFSVKKNCPDLHHIVAVDAVAKIQATDWHALLAGHSSQFKPEHTLATEAAVLIYTSGTTGPPKGALIPHSALIGNLTGFVASQNWFPQNGDVFWSPADWAWTGGLMDALLPTLYFGKSIVGYHGRFSAETAFYLLQKHKITNSFLFPTALKMMMKAYPAPRTQFNLHLRAIMCAGEAVGDAVFNWCQSALGVTLNEMFGQTEINYVVGNSVEKWPARAGSMGRAYPGHYVAVLNEQNQLCKAGEIGEVAVSHTDIHGTPDPVFFLGYWNNPKATLSKTVQGVDANGKPRAWCKTGDLAYQDADGYLWYSGRADDMFKAAGYRIGPSEIENCLVKHPAVANAAVVPKPDAERGNLVKAYVVLTPEYAALQNTAELIAALQSHVRGQLAPYEYPKEIEFIDALPMTTTGKVQRRVLRLQEEEKARQLVF